MSDPEVVQGAAPDAADPASTVVEADDAAEFIHADVAEGRQAASPELASALAIEAAQKAVGCPTPPAVQAVIDAASDDQVAEIRKTIAGHAAGSKRRARKAGGKTKE